MDLKTQLQKNARKIDLIKENEIKNARDYFEKWFVDYLLERSKESDFCSCEIYLDQIPNYKNIRIHKFKLIENICEKHGLSFCLTDNNLCTISWTE